MNRILRERKKKAVHFFPHFLSFFPNFVHFWLKIQFLLNFAFMVRFGAIDADVCGWGEGTLEDCSRLVKARAARPFRERGGAEAWPAVFETERG